MGMNKVTSFQSPLSGISKPKISVGFIGEFVTTALQPSLKWWGINISPAPKTADVIVYSFGSSIPFQALGNRGTPVIVVDEEDSPSISPELLCLLRRPEVRLCFRRYGFRDPQAYFRCDDYYEEAYQQAVRYNSPPDHFPIYADNPLGNAIRKTRVSLPVCDEFPETSGFPAISDRDIDVLFIESCGSAQVNALREQWEGLPGNGKRWIADSTSQQNSMSWFEASKIFVSAGPPSPLDLCAFLSGCVVVKPECSNIYASLDIYDPMKLCIWHCDVTFKELPSIISYVLSNIDECEARVQESRTMLLDGREDMSWAAEFREACVRVVRGESRLGDVTSALPLGK